MTATMTSQPTAAELIAEIEAVLEQAADASCSGLHTYAAQLEERVTELTELLEEIEAGS